ncbi:hypothetical protein Zmor_022141 [Zophobas morio]|uniref:Uncharacterized protein n=1 Tax=Zophobas morio TaxID=2755281 RepID=A0AA38M636_9CUCU|nr:hypothetical protein Zmor_022141 [Zophobas morio]
MFPISEDLKKKVYESFNRTEVMVNTDAETIKKWMKTQQHFPEEMDNSQIKNFLLLNKFSIEKTKRKIDMYYTIRSLLPDFYVTSNPKLENMQQALDQV